MLDDWFNREVEDAFQKFVEAGGLDSVHPGVNEDWERRQRQETYCSHNMPTARCPQCRHVLPVY